MAASPHDDTRISNFGDHLRVERQNPPSASSNETPSILESSEFLYAKPSHGDVLEGGPQKEEPETIWSFKCADNGDFMRDYVSMLDKTGAAGTQVPGQTVGLNSKSGVDDNHEVDGYIEFKDCMDRRFRFPYKGVKKWKVVSFSQDSYPGFVIID